MHFPLEPHGVLKSKFNQNLANTEGSRLLLGHTHAHQVDEGDCLSVPGIFSLNSY